MSKDDFELVRGSGNVFRDFAVPNADLEQARTILAARIIGVLDDRKLTVRAAEKLTGVAASEFSRIRRVKLGRFTLDRMITILGKLDHDLVPDRGPAHYGVVILVGDDCDPAHQFLHLGAAHEFVAVFGKAGAPRNDRSGHRELHAELSL